MNQLIKAKAGATAIGAIKLCRAATRILPALRGKPFETGLIRRCYDGHSRRSIRSSTQPVAMRIK